MGGYGTLHLGFKYPETFGALSSIAGALLPRLDQEPLERVEDTFCGSQEYYDDCHPFNLLEVCLSA
jgi:S-formylglutathione hydrolase FrmB